MTTPMSEADLLDNAEAYAKAFNVPLRTAAAAIRAEAELDELAVEHHAGNPQLTPEQAYVKVLNTPKGAELYATANPRPQSRTKAVQVDPKLLYKARITLLGKLHPKLENTFDANGQPTDYDKDFAKRVGPGLTKVTESRIVDEALKLLIEHVSSPDHAEGQTGLAWFDK